MRGVFELIDRRHALTACSRRRSGFSRRARRSRRCTTPRSPAALCSWRARAPAPPRPGAADRTPRRRSASVPARRAAGGTGRASAAATGFRPGACGGLRQRRERARSSLSIAVTLARSASRNANGPTPQNRSAMVFDFAGMTGDEPRQRLFARCGRLQERARRQGERRASHRHRSAPRAARPSRHAG